MKRWPAALLGLYALLTALQIGTVVRWEPFTFDAWNIAVDTNAEPFSLGRWIEYGTGQYLHSNPRLGQWFAYPAYKLELFAVIATPLAFLALAAAVTVLGLGRWPDLRSRRDAGLGAIALGFCWFALPSIGMLLFCRAYATNYIYTAALQLWFLVPLRLRADGVASNRACIAYAVAGLFAGLCNEHTGPTFLVLFGVVVYRSVRRGALSRLAAAGGVGYAIGFLLIFFAPGQGERYDGLATKVGFVGRLLQRSIGGTLDIYRDFLVAAGPLLLLGALALAVGLATSQDTERLKRGALGFLGAFALASLLAATVFVSPKLGPRFFLLGCALLLAAVIALADRALTTRRLLAPLVVLAVAASGYAAFRTLPLYARLHANSEERLAALAAAPVGSVFTADSFDQVDISWWSLGDDFRDVKKRELVTRYFALGGVTFRAVDLDAPLGISDAVLVPRAAGDLDVRRFHLDDFRGLDIGSVHRAVKLALEMLTAAAPGAQVDVVVDFVGDPPPGLPRPTLLVGRWQHGAYQGWAGAISRPGMGKERRVTLPPELRTRADEVFIYHVGSRAQRLGLASDGDLRYVPWKRGTYWALACDARECFVFAATRLR